MKRLLVALLMAVFMFPAASAFADEGDAAAKPAKGAKAKKGKGGGKKGGGGGPCYAVCKAEKKMLFKKGGKGACKAALRKWKCNKEDKPVLKGKRGGGGKKGKGGAKAKPDKGAAEKTE